MFNLFKYSYKLQPTGKPDVVYLVPTAETWMKAFAPSAILLVGAGALYAYATYQQHKFNEALLEAEDTLDSHE